MQENTNDFSNNTESQNFYAQTYDAYGQNYSSYGQTNDPYGQQYQQTPQKPKKNKVPGILLLVIGTILLIAGIVIVFMGGQTSKMESDEAVDVFYATETDQYAFAKVQYMTEAVAYYEAMENMQFYIVCDANWNPYVICLHSDELEKYQPYIDWLYTDEEEGGPQEMTITGYAQPFDPSLEVYVVEGFADTWGSGIVDIGNFEEWFGAYYLQVGEKNGAYNFTNIGIFLLLAALVLLVIGAVLIYEKPEAAQGGPIVQSGNVGLGILGALLGALLGGLAWAIVGAMGYISGWLGILIIIFAYKGYEMTAHKTDTFGLVISIVFGLIVILPATYLSYAWSYYQALNESMGGYTSLGRALMELPAYMESADAWGEFVGNVVMGYVFMIIAAIYFFAGQISNKKKKK